MAYWVKDEHLGDYSDWLNELMDGSDDSWDADEAMEAIVTRYVTHMVAEVKRLGGCLRPWCMWDNAEPCDHGYLAEPVAPRSDVMGMCPHCGIDVQCWHGLTLAHTGPASQNEPVSVCPGSGQIPRCAESDARPLWNGQPNTRFRG